MAATGRTSKKKTAGKKGTDVAVPASSKKNLPSTHVADMRGDAGGGLEDVGQSDLAIPFLKILEALSPEVNKRDDKYVEGAEQGDIYDPVSETLWKGEEGFLCIPVGYKKEDIVWRPRTQGGGLVSVHHPSEQIMSKTVKTPDGKKDILPDTNNEVIPTAQHFVLVLDGDGGYWPAIISMTKTRLKKSRKWNSQMMQLKVEDEDGKFTPPIFGTIYKVTTDPESNDQGNWFSWHMEYEGLVLKSDWPELYAEAKMMAEGIKQAKVRYDDLRSGPTDDNVSSPQEDQTGTQSPAGDDIPF